MVTLQHLYERLLSYRWVVPLDFGCLRGLGPLGPELTQALFLKRLGSILKEVLVERGRVSLVQIPCLPEISEQPLQSFTSSAKFLQLIPGLTKIIGPLHLLVFGVPEFSFLCYGLKTGRWLPFGCLRLLDLLLGSGTALARLALATPASAGIPELLGTSDLLELSAFYQVAIVRVASRGKSFLDLLVRDTSFNVTITPAGYFIVQDSSDQLLERLLF